MTLTKEETQELMDRVYSNGKDMGLSHQAAGDAAKALALRLGHTCYSSILGPYCVVCHRDMQKEMDEAYAKAYMRCPRCEGVGVVKR